MAGTIIAVIVAVLVALLISVPLTYNLAIAHKAQQDAITVGTAEDKARSIIDEAIKQAESKKKRSFVGSKGGNFPHQERVGKRDQGTQKRTAKL